MADSTEQKLDALRLRWPLGRIEALEKIAEKPAAGDNRIFVCELLDALKQALYAE